METSTVVGLLALAGLAAVVALAIYRARIHAAQNARHARFISGYRFPPELLRRLQERRPALDERQRALVLEGLRQYFLACLAARNGAIAKQLGMPSKAVDDAWHEFIVMTRDYATFCTGAFGRYLHHTPKQQMQEPIDNALANTLHQLKRPAMGGGSWAMLGAMPLLFALDRELGLDDGHRYDAAALQDLEVKRRLLAASSGGETASTASTDPSCNPSSVSCDGGGSAGGCGGGGCGSS